MDAAGQAVRAAAVALDKAAAKGALHPNNASRRKSRLMSQLSQAGTEKS
jgi:ribosomal protein S20